MITANLFIPTLTVALFIGLVGFGVGLIVGWFYWRSATSPVANELEEGNRERKRELASLKDNGRTGIAGENEPAPVSAFNNR